MKQEKITIKVARTLYHNAYRCQALNEQNQVIALLRIIPQLPLSAEEVPADAPVVPPYLLVIVEDADITKETLVNFEENLSVALLNRFTTEDAIPQNCQFYYPSPAFFFEDKNLKNDAPMQ